VRFREMVSASVRAKWGVALAAGALLAILGGCNSFLDQSEITRGPHADRLVVQIIDSIDPIDEAKQEYGNAEDAKAEDLKVISTDYVIGRNDLVTVSVFDLVNAGIEQVRTVRVSETGMITLPMLPDPVMAVGLTEPQLQKAIALKYKEAGLLPNAQVGVTVVEARQRTFNITGAVVRPGQYAIVDSDFRVLQALVVCGDTTFPAEYLYVIRKRSAETPSQTAPVQPQQAAPAPPTTGPADLAPRTGAQDPEEPVALADEPAAKPEPAPAKQAAPGNEARYGTVEGKSVLITSTQPADGEGTLTAPAPTTQPGAAATQPPYEFGADTKVLDDQRIIRVSLAGLKNGDLRQNIVIRPGDLIYVQVPLTGVYYMGGHVAAPGAYNLAGQKITLTAAIYAARGLDPMAVPSRTDVIRRVAGDKEVIVRVDLMRISEGREPNIYLKPNDMVVVGTDFYPPFLAAVRGAFRITYGFGFLYDRNYAPSQETRYAR